MVNRVGLFRIDIFKYALYMILKFIFNHYIFEFLVLYLSIFIYFLYIFAYLIMFLFQFLIYYFGKDRKSDDCLEIVFLFELG